MNDITNAQNWSSESIYIDGSAYFENMVLRATGSNSASKSEKLKHFSKLKQDSDFGKFAQNYFCDLKTFCI